MTVSLYVTIWCDEGYDQETHHRACPNRFDEPVEVTVTRARRKAREHGWSVSSGPTRRDLCPTHSRARVAR